MGLSCHFRGSKVARGRVIARVGGRRPSSFVEPGQCSIRTDRDGLMTWATPSGSHRTPIDLWRCRPWRSAHTGLLEHALLRSIRAARRFESSNSSKPKNNAQNAGGIGRGSTHGYSRRSTYVRGLACLADGNTAGTVGCAAG